VNFALLVSEEYHEWNY